MTTRYLLVDFESVQPESFAELDPEQFQVLVFIGPHQHKVSFEQASSLHRMGSRADYVKVTCSGTNALDFHLACYLGRLTFQDPDGIFHILSKDTGFDPLIQHLNERDIRAFRCASLAEVVRGTSPESSLDAWVTQLVANLRTRGTSRPRTVKTLTSTIRNLFQAKLKDPDIECLLKRLEARCFIAIQDQTVTYLQS